MMQLNSGESRSVLGKEIYVNFLLMILLLFFKNRSLDGFAVQVPVYSIYIYICY